MKNKTIKSLLFGLITGVIIWFLIDLIWDWEGNVDSFNKGREAARGINTEVND